MNEEFELALVEEEAVAELQSMVIRILRDKKMTQKQLAEAMDVTPSYISQILSDEPQNLTIKRAASLFHHLGESLHAYRPIG
jgi:transcriptional regulator with XRE-family HTH domain